MVARENVLAIAYGTESSYLHENSIWVALGDHILDIATSGSAGPWTMGYSAQQSHRVASEKVLEMWLGLTMHMA